MMIYGTVTLRSWHAMYWIVDSQTLYDRHLTFKETQRVIKQPNDVLTQALRPKY
jgi:hypothetical protein